MEIIFGVLHLTLPESGQRVRFVICVRFDVSVRRSRPPNLYVFVQELELIEQWPLAAVDPVLHDPSFDCESTAEVRHPFLALVYVHLAESTQLPPSLLLL